VSEIGSESKLSAFRKAIILWRDDTQGATAIEYSLIAGFVSSAIITIVFVLGINVLGLLQSIADLWPA
jgi:Flp pilus assembly pilin Flp